MLQNPAIAPGVVPLHWRQSPSLAQRPSLVQGCLAGCRYTPVGVASNDGGGRGRSAPRRGLWRMRCYTRSGRFDPF